MKRADLLELYRRHLDDELTPDDQRALGDLCAREPAAAAELAALAELRRELPALPAPEPSPDFTERLMRRLPAQVPERHSLWRWLTRPRALQVSPALGLAALVVAVGLTALLVSYRRAQPAPQTRAASPSPPPTAPDAPPVVEVRFVLAAPNAHKVTLVGDFNGWRDGELELASPGKDGVWTVTVPLEPGQYAYQFVIDGTQWQPDPNAQATVSDGFGGTNSLLRI